MLSLMCVESIRSQFRVTLEKFEVLGWNNEMFILLFGANRTVAIADRELTWSPNFIFDISTMTASFVHTIIPDHLIHVGR
jgi:hypothetical protein